MSFFSSPLSDAVDKATSDLLLGPDMVLNMNVVDLIVSKPENGKKGANLILKKIKNKHPKVQLMALGLLDTCLRNCNEIFISHFASKNYYGALQSMLDLQGRLVDRHVQEKILEFIQTWAYGFKEYNSIFPIFWSTYQDMKNKGVQFPTPREDQTKAFSLRFTPAFQQQRARAANTVVGGGWGTQGVEPQGQVYAGGQPVQANADTIAQQQMLLDMYAQQRAETQGGNVTRPPSHYPPASPQPVEAPVQPTPQLLAPNATKEQIFDDIESIKANYNLLSELLSFVDPNTEDVRQNELIQELLAVARETQPRIAAFLGTVEDDAIMMVLLEANDELNRVNTTYERLCAQVRVESPHSDAQPQPEGATMPPTAAYAPAAAALPADAPLIDLSDDETVAPVPPQYPTTTTTTTAAAAPANVNAVLPVSSITPLAPPPGSSTPTRGRSHSRPNDYHSPSPSPAPGQAKTDGAALIDIFSPPQPAPVPAYSSGNAQSLNDSFSGLNLSSSGQQAHGPHTTILAPLNHTASLPQSSTAPTGQSQSEAQPQAAPKQEDDPFAMLLSRHTTHQA